MKIFSVNMMLYGSFFMAAIFNKPLYLPILIIYLSINKLKIEYISIDRKTFIFIILILFFLIPLYTIGYDGVYLPNPISAMFYILSLILIGGYALYYATPKSRCIAIIFFALGIFFENLCVALYSFYTDPKVYGYGNLISPFGDGEINSPSVSNSLAIGFVIFEYLLINSKSNSVKIISLALTIITFMMAIFLAGRSFIIIIFINTLFLSIYHKNFRNLLFILVLLTGLYITFFLSSIDLSSNLTDTFLRRLEMGIDSGRFPLLIQGSSELLLHPLGGFSVDKSIEDTYWFHNIFIDAGRISGWLPVLSLFAAIFIVVRRRIHTISNDSFDVADIIFLTTLLLIQQDVIIEGDYKKFILFYFSCLSILLIKSKKL